MQQHSNWVEKYGRFELDMNNRLDLDPAAPAGAVPGPRAPEGARAGHGVS